MTSAPSLTSPTNVLGQQDFIELGGHFFATPLGSHVAQWACRALSIHKINALHHQYRTYSGAAFTERVLADPRVNVTYHVVGKENLQAVASSPFIAIANHPFGGLDGLILIDFMLRLFPHFKLVVNSFLGRIQALRESFIPIRPRTSQKSYTHNPLSNVAPLKAINQHLNNGHPLGIFPAGGVAQTLHGNGISWDQPWQNSSLKLLKRAQVPLVPILIWGANSKLYHRLSPHYLLKTLKVPSELFNKQGQNIPVFVGPPILPNEVAAVCNTSFGNYNKLRNHLYQKLFSLHNYNTTPTV